MTIVALKHFYKAYHLDKNGNLRDLELIEATSDRDALQQIEDRRANHLIEVWDRSRMVGEVQASRGARMPVAVSLESLMAAAATSDKGTSTLQ